MKRSCWAEVTKQSKSITSPSNFKNLNLGSDSVVVSSLMSQLADKISCLARRCLSHLWSKPGSLVTVFSTYHPRISLVNLVKILSSLAGYLWFQIFWDVVLYKFLFFYKINIHKRPQDHVTFFPLLFHLSLGQTLQFLRPRRQPVLSGAVNTRDFPFPQQCCTPGWKFRISDISDLTYKTFCLAEGKYLSALKPAFFFFFRLWSEWWWVHSNMLLYRLCVLNPTPRHIPGAPRGVSWVLCHINLRQDCGTWEPGLPWKWGHQASDLWQLHPALSSSWQFNSIEDVCLHFDKPKPSISVVLLWKAEICELKDTWKMLIFLETVFPTAKKKLSEWWFIPNWL